MPTYANGRRDPCGIGSGTSDKELFHKKDAFVGVFFDFLYGSRPSGESVANETKTHPLCGWKIKKLYKKHLSRLY